MAVAIGWSDHGDGSSPMAREKMTDVAVGIGMSKGHLDAFRLEDDAAQRFENSATGLRALIKWLGRTTVARILHEPTGPWHRAFEVALSGHFPRVEGQPASGARRFAEATGTRARPMPSMPACWPGRGPR